MSAALGLARFVLARLCPRKAAGAGLTWPGRGWEQQGTSRTPALPEQQQTQQ